MGKPRLIILIRHAQSEGNKNREIHQMIPDHRVKLTEEGCKQAEEAGRRLRSLLKPDDTLQFYTSPYRRTRETTEGILRTLTSNGDDQYQFSAPSPFSRHAIKVYEEPRLREQDFGNFQPCSAEMERMWQERADYGHFFYRIPNGESAADAYDRVSGFNESLWRSFSEADFPSVCVIVTHGLMTRVFLMKWYHWSVEYFEDLRNVNHCEMILMDKNPDNGKFVMQNQLRTWSELKRQKAAEAAKHQAPSPQHSEPHRRNTLSQFLPKERKGAASPPTRRWGGCVGGCNHHHERYPRRAQNALPDLNLPPAAVDKEQRLKTDGASDQSVAPEASSDGWVALPRANGAADAGPQFKVPFHDSLAPGRDGGGTESGAASPHEALSDDSDYFEPPHQGPMKPRALAKALRNAPKRKPTPDDIERWANESGMGTGMRADALGDEPTQEEGIESAEDEDEEKLADEAEDEIGADVVKERLRSEVDQELKGAQKQEQSVSGSVY